MPAPRACSRLIPALVLVLALGGFAASCSSSSSGRPATTAKLQILTPAPNAAVAGGDVDLDMKLVNAKVVPAYQVGGKIRPDRGHIHVSVDGQVTQMFYGVVQKVPNLTPGKHTIQAEFVASDHLPFSNRVVAAVTFEVK
jgi:hypothetical protein